MKITKKDHKDIKVYKLKEGTGKLCRQAFQYNAQQVEFIKNKSRPTLFYFGFVKHAEESKRDEGQFFTFDSETAEDKHSEFLEHNKKLLAGSMKGIAQTWDVNQSRAETNVVDIFWHLDSANDERIDIKIN